MKTRGNSWKRKRSVNYRILRISRKCDFPTFLTFLRIRDPPEPFCRRRILDNFHRIPGKVEFLTFPGRDAHFRKTEREYSHSTNFPKEGFPTTSRFDDVYDLFNKMRSWEYRALSTQLPSPVGYFEKNSCSTHVHGVNMSFFANGA